MNSGPATRKHLPLAAARSFSPGPLARGRLALGSLLLGTLVLSRPRVRPTRRELALLVLAGLLWFGVYQVVLNESERRVDAGTASMLVLVAPIFIVALAAVFLKERTTPNLLLGGALCLVGVYIARRLPATTDPDLALRR